MQAGIVDLGFTATLDNTDFSLGWNDAVQDKPRSRKQPAELLLGALPASDEQHHEIQPKASRDHRVYEIFRTSNFCLGFYGSSPSTCLSIPFVLCNFQPLSGKRGECFRGH